MNCNACTKLIYILWYSILKGCPNGSVLDTRQYLFVAVIIQLLEFWRGIIIKNLFQDKFQSFLYIGFYNKQPVAMFSLENHKDQLLDTCKLSYVYVKQEYRGLGFGKQIIDKAKSLALNEKACILLDTLKPGLNTLYIKHGAKVICESRVLTEPTQVLRMTPNVTIENSSLDQCYKDYLKVVDLLKP